MPRYTILWGHSGTRGREWSTAREASAYAAETWGHVDATGPEDAVRQVETETRERVLDWHAAGDSVHVVFAGGGARA